MTAFLDEVAEATGLSSLFARRSVERACERAGVDPAQLSPATYRKVLPELERGIRGFFDEEGFRIARKHLHALLTRKS